MPLTSDSPLDQPLYGATLPQAVGRFFGNYATFTGRASRSEFWWWALVMATVNIIFGAIIGLSLTLADTGEGASTGAASIMLTTVYLIYPLVSLGLLIPSLALFWRRLHDANKPGVYILFVLIPFGVGTIMLLIFMLLPPDPAGQRFDKEPVFAPTPAWAAGNLYPQTPSLNKQHTEAALGTTPREALRSIAMLIAPNEPAVLDLVTLAIDNPEQYVANHTAQLARRGLEEPVPELGWIVLVDALYEQNLLTELDWKEESDDVLTQLRQLKSAPNGPVAWAWADAPATTIDRAANVDVDIESVLTQAGRGLAITGTTLVSFDINSDSYPVALISTEQTRTLLELALAAGHRVQVH